MKGNLSWAAFSLSKKGGHDPKALFCFYFTLCPIPQSPSRARTRRQMLLIHLIMLNPGKCCCTLAQGKLYALKIALFLFFFGQLLLNLLCFLLWLRAQQVPQAPRRHGPPAGPYPKPHHGGAVGYQGHPHTHLWSTDSARDASR